jgi:hypothetical protein
VSARHVAWLVGASLAVAALTLLAPWALAFDPYAWLGWGRDVLRLDLDTSAGPSWKPLPVLVTTPLSLTDGAAPALWLVVARAGGLLALAGAARVAWRLTGGSAVAAATAAAVTALGPWWLFNTALGNSEGLLAAAVLWAIAAHLDGHRRVACALLLAAALMRPEAWVFLYGYGVWLWRREPGARVLVAAAAVTVPLLWFGPDAIGVGGAIGASHAALGTASVGSAALSKHPVLTVLTDAVKQLTLPVALAAVVGAVLGGAPARWLAALAVAWVVEVAAMTAVGYAGNPRYLDAAAAVGCALAGVGVAALGARVAGPSGKVAGRAARVVGGAGTVVAAPARTRQGDAAAAGAAAAVVIAMLAVGLGDLRAQTRQLGVRADRRSDLETLLRRVGGAGALRACGTVRASESMRTMVAWRVDVPLLDLETQPVVPGAALLAAPYEGGQDKPILDGAARRRFPEVTRQGAWVLRASCARLAAARTA